MTIKDKVAIVTGASTGIGQATAIALAKEGAKVVIAYNSNHHGAEETKKQIQGDSILVQADLTKEDDVEKLFQETLDAYATVDILINNAGTATGMDFGSVTTEHIQHMLNVNLLSIILCSSKAIEIMKEKDLAKIVNMSSIHAIANTDRPSILTYSAAKAGVIKTTQNFARAYGPNILVNTVAPGRTYTNYYKTATEEIIKQSIEQSIIKRFIKPEEIADAILFLLKNDAVTGETLVIDGGLSLY